MPKVLPPGGAFHMDRFNPIYLMAHTLGGIGMFGALLVFKRVLFGPAIPTSEVGIPALLSGMMIGAAWVLVRIADKAGRRRD